MTLDQQPDPWTTWSAGGNCFKTTDEYDELVLDEHVESAAPDGTRVYTCEEPNLAPLDEAGLPPIYLWGDDDGPAVLSHNLRYRWKMFNEIWWQHNSGSAVWEVMDNNLDAAYEARFAVVAEYLRGGDWMRSRLYDEQLAYFDHEHSRYLNYPVLPWDGPIFDFPGPGFGGWTVGGASKTTFGEGAPGPFTAGLLGDSVPVLLQAKSGSQSQPLPYQRCGFDSAGTPADGSVQGASLAFVDPQRGRVVYEVCANQSADGAFPRAVDPAFEVLGWLGEPGAASELTVALYGGRLADGTVSDDLWLGVVERDGERGAPVSLRWERQEPAAGSFRPPGLAGARLVAGYGGEGLYLLGGVTESGGTGGLFRYRPGSGACDEIEPSGSIEGLAVSGAAAARHTNVVYLHGGARSNGVLSDGLFALYLPSGRVERVADGPPVSPARRGASLAISERTGRLYLFGGHDGTSGRNDVWSLPLGAPGAGWRLESSSCDDESCPGAAGGVLLLDRSDDSPVVAGSFVDDGLGSIRTRKRARGGWVLDRELGDRDAAADCDDDLLPEPGWGAVCGQGQWWSRLGLSRCDYEFQDLYCDQLETTPTGWPRIYARPGITDFDAMGNVAVVARGRKVEFVDPARGLLTPARVADVAFDRRVRAVAAYGGFVYAAVRDGLEVVDARIPEAPVPAGWIPLGSTPTDLVVAEGRLYVVDYGGLTEFVLQDPLAPETGAAVDLFADCDLDEWLDEWCEALFDGDEISAEPWEEELCALIPHRVEAHGGAVAVSADEDVILVRATDPEAMMPLAVVDTGVIVGRMRLFGSHLYLSGPLGERVVSVRDPLAPELVSTSVSVPVRSWVDGRELIGDYMARRWLGYLVFQPIAAVD